MEMSEAGEHQRRPELERSHPDQIFTYAKDKEQWIRDNLNPYRVAEEIDALIHELNTFIADNLGSLPEVIVSSENPMRLRSLDARPAGLYLLSTELAFDDDEKILNRTTFVGNLYGFGAEKNDDGTVGEVRAYIDTGSDEIPTAGGIFKPMISINMSSTESSEEEAATKIILAGYEDRTYVTELEDTIKKVALDSYGPEVYEWVMALMDILNDHGDTDMKKLVKSEGYILDIAKRKGIDAGFVDNLLEIIKLQLRLELPHDIDASSYRQHLSNGYIRRNEPRYLPHVTPSLTLIGDSIATGGADMMGRKLALSVIQGKEWVDIEVRHINLLTKSAPFKK